MAEDFNNYVEGRPYIFVSCSALDLNEVVPDLKWMISSGYNIKFIDYHKQTSSIEQVNNDIKNCKQFVIFLSDSFIEDKEQKRRIEIAALYKLPILAINLNNVVLNNFYGVLFNTAKRADKFENSDYYNSIELLLDSGCKKVSSKRNTAIKNNDNIKKKHVKRRVIVLVCCFILVAVALSGYLFTRYSIDINSFAAGLKSTVINNGGNVIQDKKNTYYITDNLAYQDIQTKGALYSVNSEGVSRKIADIGGKHIWEEGNFVYVSSENLDDSIYKINPVSGKSALLFNGAIDFIEPDNNNMYYSAYSTPVKQGLNFQGLYKYNINTLKANKIVESNTVECGFLSVISDKLYYYTTTKDNLVSIYSYDLKTGKSSLLTTDKPDSNEDIAYEDEYSLEVTQLSACGEWLIYSVGSYQGSGEYYSGKMFRIKPDGTGKVSMNMADSSLFQKRTVICF